jgi:DNA polymerase-3 subunit alpha
MSDFVHLHTHSHYSLLDGLSKIDELVARAKELGMSSLALTDHGALYGAVEFYKKALQAGIKPILGVETYVAPKSRTDREPSEKYYHLILLCENNRGWENLIQLVTKAHLEGYYYKPRVDKELLRQHHEGLIALSACLAGEVNRFLMADKFEEAKMAALEYEEIFGKGNFYLEVGSHDKIKDCASLKEKVLKLAREISLPLVATQDIHYLRPEDAQYHDTLLAVQTGSKLGDNDRLTLKEDDFSMTSPKEMYERFRDTPEAVVNTVKIANRCNATLDLGRIILPDFPKPEGKSADAYLRELVLERLPRRFPEKAQQEAIRDRLDYELSVILKTGFADYFLIVQDLVNWAKSHGISVGPGRGSAASSIVSYILNVTDVDPLKYDLLFERFLNPERIEMPDVDIDFADTRRDEVLAYARQKYGDDKVAQIITFGTMGARAAVRDSGRAMGMAYGFCDQIAKLIPFNSNLEDAIAKTEELRELYNTNLGAKKLLETARHLEGVARHASVHACGTVISKEPLVTHVPLQFAPQDKVSIITQFDMDSIQDLGLLKIDLLGLKNLTIIEETLRLVGERRGTAINVSELPLDDAPTFKLLRDGNTTGVFQLESTGIRHYLKDLKPTELEDIIAMVSLYRPGTLDSGMVPHYIARKNGRERITYLHPLLEPILKTTYGIGLYQEQMMRIARDLAGFTLPEADTLRKAIGKKIKTLLDEQKERLIQGMLKRGIDEKTAQAIWELFPPFARYGFNRSHAVCYALIAYRTAYLKTHYQEEFMASLLNAESQDIERIAFLVNEARASGLTILPPDINKSFAAFTPEGADIRFGLLAIKNLGDQIAQSIVEERTRNGPFKSLSDVLLRVTHKDLNKKSLESLTKTGVFDSLGIERNQAMQNIEEILRFNTAMRKNGAGQPSLFGGSIAPATLKLKEAPPATSQEKLAWEKELLGFYLSDHPLNSLQDEIKAAKVHSLAEAREVKSESQTVRVAGLVAKLQRITTKAGQPMLFATLEDLSPQPLEVVVFNNTLSKTESAWKENAVVVVSGRMSRRNGEVKLICENAKPLA